MVSTKDGNGESEEEDTSNGSEAGRYRLTYFIYKDTRCI